MSRTTPITILASMTGLGSDRSVMAAALALARIQGGYIQGLHIRIDAVETAAMIGAFRQPNLHNVLDAISSQEEERSRHARKVFDETCQGVADTAISPVWTEKQSFLNETLHEARYHDLCVMGRNAELSGERIITVLTQSGRPLLLAPSEPVERIGKTVAIAWKHTAEAARAVGAASFLLANAEKVLILSVSEDKAGDARLSANGLAAQMENKGIAAEVRVSSSPSVSTAQALSDLALGGGADILVMGAYGHSRIREFVFGGVTTEFLSTAALPLFMVG